MAEEAESDKAADDLRAGEWRLATAREGELKIRREPAAKLEAELLLLPELAQQVIGEMLAEARAGVQAASEDLRRIEDEIHGKGGALQHVGGEVAKQKADAAQEAPKAAREREQFLETDYAACEPSREPRPIQGRLTRPRPRSERCPHTYPRSGPGRHKHGNR